MLVRTWSNYNPYVLLVEGYSGRIIQESSISYKIKHILDVTLSNSTPRYLYMRNKNIAQREKESLMGIEFLFSMMIYGQVLEMDSGDGHTTL